MEVIQAWEREDMNQIKEKTVGLHLFSSHPHNSVTANFKPKILSF